MPSCREATRLISESQDRPLRLTEKVSLRIHILRCAGCRNFEKSVEMLRVAMQNFAGGEFDSKDDRDRSDSKPDKS